MPATSYCRLPRIPFFNHSTVQGAILANNSKTVLAPRVTALRTSSVFLGLMLSAGITTAQEVPTRGPDALTFLVGAGIRHDDNIYRLNSDADVLALTGKSARSDQIRTVTAGIRLDEQYSQQHFLVAAGVADNRYQTYSNLNFVAKNYQAEWQWYLTSRFTGQVAADRAQNLADFRDYPGSTSRNVVTTENRRFVADWWATGGWHMVGGVVETRQDFSQQNTTTAASSRLRSGEGGVRYATESGDSVTLLERRGNGEYPDRAVDTVTLIDNRFSQNETELSLGYRLSGKSVLTGRLARVERKHDNVPVRDYTGTTGLLDWRWDPTAVIGVNFAAGRDIVSYQDATTSYYTNDRLSIAPRWAMSAKTSLGLRYEQDRRNYQGAVTPIVVAREDRVRIVGLTLVWAPTTTVSVTGSLQRESLTSNISVFEYTANIASLTVQATF
jgi:exopolysaccharide biosynthesis operon protein EpsL